VRAEITGLWDRRAAARDDRRRSAAG
jgi:hypothetical protein